MTRILTALSALLLAGLLVSVTAAPAEKKQEAKKEDAKKVKPKVEVVFCLDTTGSMGHLIAGAKAKIWSLCNQIAGGKPTPDVRVGLVAYRDKGDDYVTKVFDLTDDLDEVHANLKKFQASGGGDEPEHVNKALEDSVNKIKWSTDTKTLRIIFLVGDAPPHTDYKDDVKYPDTCKKACEKGIIINTIQCGGNSRCATHWKEIAKKAEGTYVAIDQKGGVEVVKTPHDKRLQEINSELARSTVVYGAPRMQAEAMKKAKTAAALPAPAAADRAGFAGKSRKNQAGDLIDALKDKKVDLKTIKEAELPAELQKLKTAKEREAYVKKVAEKREKLNKEARELDKKRTAYIAEQVKKTGKGKDSFDNKVLEMLRKQAKKYKIEY